MNHFAVNVFMIWDLLQVEETGFRIFCKNYESALPAVGDLQLVQPNRENLTPSENHDLIRWQILKMSMPAASCR